MFFIIGIAWIALILPQNADAFDNDAFFEDFGSGNEDLQAGASW